MGNNFLAWTDNAVLIKIASNLFCAQTSDMIENWTQKEQLLDDTFGSALRRHFSHCAIVLGEWNVIMKGFLPQYVFIKKPFKKLSMDSRPATISPLCHYLVLYDSVACLNRRRLSWKKVSELGNEQKSKMHHTKELLTKSRQGSLVRDIHFPILVLCGTTVHMHTLFSTKGTQRTTCHQLRTN